MLRGLQKAFNDSENFQIKLMNSDILMTSHDYNTQIFDSTVISASPFAALFLK